VRGVTSEVKGMKTTKSPDDSHKENFLALRLVRKCEMSYNEESRAVKE
jgi:hypothetical protein